MKSGIAVLIYAFIVFLGGIIGYVKAHSFVSLSTGIAFAMMLGISGWALIKGKIAGFYSSLSLALALGIFFSVRFFQTYKFMPPGLMCLLSFIIIAYLLSSSLVKDKQAS
jgi:uncharacterized membrane protein (UPF0136 family)